MFPCNFLYFMRQQDYESSNCSNLFNGKFLEHFVLFVDIFIYISRHCESLVVNCAFASSAGHA